jgi:3-dehydroquinate synthetase
VLADLDVLDTLPGSRAPAGYAEVLKHALLATRRCSPG